MAKKILVTGGTGFIGSALVQRLVREGHEVRILDNNWRGKEGRLQGISHQIDFQKADIRSAQAVEKGCQGIDCVFHLAFINGTEFFYSKPDLVLEVGVAGILNVLNACKKHQVSEIFLASSSEVYHLPSQIPTSETAPFCIPDPLNPRYSYAGGKMISELLAVNYGRKFFERVVIFRPHNVYGPDMGWEHVIPQFVLRFRELIKKEKEPIVFPIQGTGNETRAFVYIDDFIEGVMKAFEKGEHLNIYHIGTVDEVSIKQVAQGIAKIFGKTITIKPGKDAPGSTPRRCPDISKIRSLGYDPTVSLDQGLKKTVKWYDEHAHQKPDNK